MVCLQSILIDVYVHSLGHPNTLVFTRWCLQLLAGDAHLVEHSSPEPGSRSHTIRFLS